MSSWEDDDSAAAAAAAAAASTDVELLKRAWRNEKASPEILRFDSPLVSRVREQIQLLVGFPLLPFPSILDSCPIRRVLAQIVPEFLSTVM
ncbi:Os05g0143400 [Oryza sativa Japonica Group]|uniref:Os05g0143400 protein n=1 Tax=Oryza sativa subsp. japonica TaxID=39947 RepID=Q0DKU3_ORYSJ|nr:Os05g0143400 [Oryza sativa Japonica Group]|eukprot:NP_001054616.2 Os05g0143400 [Oryza sativa Japonica Group]